jgi:site-specific DNA recombinase
VARTIAAPSDKPRAKAYLRVSTKKQAEDGESLTAQRERVEKVADAEGWSLEVVEEAESTKRERPKLEALMADLDFDVLVIAKVDRFGRTFAHNVELKARLDEAGVALVCLEPRIDFSTPVGELVWANLSAVAQMERTNIGQRVSDTSKLHRAAGKAAGGPRPYGYRRKDGGGLAVDQAEAVIVLRLYREYVAGRSVLEIKRNLDGDGVLTGNGVRWSPKSIDRVLTNPLYRGALVHKGVVVCEDAEHGAIVNPDLWQRAQDLRAARANGKGKGRGRNPKADHLFTNGLLKCGRCGGSMRPRTYPAGRGVYYCSTRMDEGVDACSQEPIDRAMIDGAAWSYFSGVVLDQEATRAEFEAVASLRLSEAQTLSEQASREVARLGDLGRRVEADYDAGDLSAKTWERKSSKVAAELEGAEAEAARLAGQLERAEADSTVSDAEADLLRWLADVRAAVAGEVESAATVAALRAALTRVFDNFVLRPERDAFDLRPVSTGAPGDMALPGGYVIEPRLRPVWIKETPMGRIEAYPGVVTTGMDVPKTNALTTT